MRRSVLKGKAFERWVARRLRGLWPDAARGLAQARSARETADVEGTLWWIEANIGRRVDVWTAYAQARAHSLISGAHSTIMSQTLAISSSSASWPRR
jgi:hypothetical protein